MATIKLHAYGNEDPGTTSCDYRGQGELHGTHKTLLEHEFGPDVTDNAEIEEVILLGPGINKVLAETFGKLPGQFGQLTGFSGLRIGVFDH